MKINDINKMISTDYIKKMIYEDNVIIFIKNERKEIRRLYKRYI